MKKIFVHSLPELRQPGAIVTNGFQGASVRFQQKRVRQTIPILFRHNRVHFADDFRPRVSNPAGILDYKCKKYGDRATIER